MKVKSFVEGANLDWSDLYFEPDGGGSFSCPFQITPTELIDFAKSDFYKADRKGLINALSNAKRAIDCQTDGFLVAIGLDPEDLKKQLGDHGIQFLSPGIPDRSVPLKFRLLQSLDFAAPSIVSKMRRLRNLLEHEYRMPRRKEVGDAIDVAELFVKACQWKMKSPMTSFGFGSGTLNSKVPREFAHYIHFNFDEDGKANFCLTYWNGTATAKSNAADPVSLTVRLGDPDFVPLLKLTWQADSERDMRDPIKTFLTETGVHFPASKFKVR
jgi:hypothetical protein